MKIVSCVIDVIRYYSINSYTQFGKSLSYFLSLSSEALEMHRQRDKQAGRQAGRQVTLFSPSEKNPSSLGGDSWRSARDSLRLRGELQFPRPCSPLPKISHHVENFPSPNMRAPCKRTSFTSNRVTVSLRTWLGQWKSAESIAIFKKRTTGHSPVPNRDSMIPRVAAMNRNQKIYVTWFLYVNDTWLCAIENIEIWWSYVESSKTFLPQKQNLTMQLRRREKTTFFT